MTWQTKLAGLKPEILARYEEGKDLERRYGKADVQPWISALHARSSALNLVPESVDLRSGLVVDVGANIGSWTHSVLSVVPTASVLAVEPAGEPLEQLRARYGDDLRVEIAAIALSDRSGTAAFHVTEHSHNSSLHRPRNMNSDYGYGWGVADTVTVPTMTLDELTRDRDLSLVKIDVQGAEGQVLAGAREALGRARAVLLEVTLRSHYVGDLLFPDLHALMVDLGYRLSGLSQPKKNSAGETLWMDACYLPNSSW